MPREDNYPNPEIECRSQTGVCMGAEVSKGRTCAQVCLLRVVEGASVIARSGVLKPEGGAMVLDYDRLDELTGETDG